MLKTAALVGIVAAVSAMGVAGIGEAAADPAPGSYDRCVEAQYVTELFTSLDRGTFPDDRTGASDRAQAFAVNAPAEIATDATLEANAITAVLNGAPGEQTLRTDPVWQAWGDVMDWHTGHCM